MNQYNYFRNITNKTLDLIFSNVENITICKPFSPLTREDNYHPALLIKLTHENIKFMDFGKPNKLNFFRANYSIINQELSNINWTEVLNFDDVDKMVSEFYNIINSTVLKSVPLIRYKNSKYPIWYSQNLIQLIKEKYKYKTKYKKYGNAMDLQKFNELRKKIKYEQRANHNKYQESIEQSLKSNCKFFFAYTKARQETNSLPNTMKYKNNESDNPETIANLFADYFEEVYENDPNDNFTNSACDCDSHFNISEENIINTIKSLDKNKNNSPDGIPSIFYINTAKEIAKPLSLIFNFSINSCKFPKTFKLSFVTPIYKSGEKGLVTNYRPISITSIAAKIFEKIIHNHIYYNNKHFISAQQHGFCMNKSTLTNLLEYSYFLANNIKNGGQIDVVYTDLKKAFDKINHIALIKKLRNFNINSCLINWIFSYLHGRNQIICINNHKSRCITPSSSVPQGSALAPLLFILFINDLPSILTSDCFLFADDLKLAARIKDINDAIRLQHDLYKIAIWCRKNKLFLNESKCVVITFTRKFKNNILTFDYKLNNITLNRVAMIKDLGVIFDEKFNFNSHCNNIAMRSFKLLGFIFRAMNKFKIPDSFILLYNAYIRTILEYCSPIWNPYYQTNIDLIEKVQRKFTRILSYKLNIPRQQYTDRLKNFKMISLSDRRQVTDEILLYKLFNNILSSHTTDQINVHIAPRFTRFTPTFYIPNASSNIEYQSTISRIQRQHNQRFMNCNLFEQSLNIFRKQVSEAICTP